MENNNDNFMPQGHSRGRKSSQNVQEEILPKAPSRGRNAGQEPKRARLDEGKNTLIRRITIFAILEVFVIVGLFIFTYATKQYNKIQRPTVDENVIANKNLSTEEIEEIEKGYWNIAVFGVDSRNSSVGKGANSDVIIIVSINRETGDIKLVSVFRDTFLKTGDNTYGKINSAYCNGGPEQALKALNENLDLNITQYVTFNWKAVVTGINILGGVDIDLSKAEYNGINGYITETVKSTGIGSTQLTQPGMQHLDGVQAVAYARLRYMDNDYARTERQRKVIQQCFEKAKQTDVETLNALLGVMLEMVATNMTWQDGLDAIGNLTKYNIAETAGFPFARGEANLGKYGACVIPQTLETNVRDLHALLFAKENYDPSEQVKNISAYISAKTGMYTAGTNVGHVSTEGWLPSDSGSAKSGSGDVSGTDESESETKETDTLRKNDDREYAISKDGYLIYVDGTDPSGNKTYKYMLDSNGKRIKMVEEDEDGNLIYLYEIDEDGNFHFNGEEQDDSESTVAPTYETDENGNILPGQGTDDEDDNGPGSATSSTKSSDYKKNNAPGNTAPTVDPDEYTGPGASSPTPADVEEEGEVYPGASTETTNPGSTSNTITTAPSLM